MIWGHEVSGYQLTEEALADIAGSSDTLSTLVCSGQKADLPGIENGDEHDLGVRLIQWAKDGGHPLSDAARLELEHGPAVLYGMSRYALRRVERLLKYADLALAMNLEAVRGETGAFDDRLHSIARPFPGQIACANNVRRLLAGSKATTDEGRYAYGYDTAPRVQDAICLRAAPQTHGGSRDMYIFAHKQVEQDIAEHSASMPRAELAITGLLTALADLAHISERRTFRLNNSSLSYGLPMNLVIGEVGINHGYPVVQATQAVSVAELKLLTMPAQNIRVGSESIAYFNICKLLKLINFTEHVFAVEVLMSGQGMDIVARKVPNITFGTGTTAAHRCLRERVTVLEKNRFMLPDMMAALELLQQGTLLSAAESAVGTLE